MKIKPILYYPTLADPRFISVVLLLGLDAYALLTPAFSRHFAQWAASVLSWVGTDALLLLLYQRVLLVPLSALVPSLAAFCLLDSPDVWPYAAVGVVAMLSKHFLRVDGKHVFNPLNFGLVIAFLFFSSHAAFDAARFEDFPMLFLWVAPLGILVSWRCARLDIALTFVGVFLLGAGARAWLSHARLLTVLAPLGSIAFYAFAFHMMTDPKTIPESRGHRLVFGAIVGVLDAVLRWFHVLNAQFYALFLVIGFLPFFRRSEGRIPSSFIWRERALRLGKAAAAVALLCLTSSCRRAPRPAPARPDGNLVLQPRDPWTPRQGARELSIQLIAEKSRIRKGERFRYRLEIQNVGREAVSFKEPAPSFIKDGSLCGLKDFRFYAKVPGGGRVELPCAPAEGGAPSSTLDVTLASGEYLLTQGDGSPRAFRDLKTGRAFTSLGRYELFVAYADALVKARSESVDLTVVP